MMGPYQRLALRMANMTLGASPEARVVIPGVTYIGQSNVIMAPNDAIMAQNDVILGAEFVVRSTNKWGYSFSGRGEPPKVVEGYYEKNNDDFDGGASPSQGTMIADAGGKLSWGPTRRLAHYRVGMLVELCVVMSKLVPAVFKNVCSFQILWCLNICVPFRLTRLTNAGG